MNKRDNDAIASGYLEAVRGGRDGRSRVSVDEVVWLVDHCYAQEDLRLELLRAVQAALPRSEEDDETSELKELLTNLIIMQTRVGERRPRLLELLRWLIEADALDGVSMDEGHLLNGIGGILSAADHVRNLAGR